MSQEKGADEKDDEDAERETRTKEVIQANNADVAPPLTNFTFTNPPSSDRRVYTSFTSGQRRLISLVLGFLTLASPLTATVYFPLLPLLQAHFGVDAQAINLTLILYVLFQALSPLLLASPSDTLGRRPVLLGTFSLYAAASLGLALNTSSYALLLVLRALQSIGASAVLAVAYGAVADVCVPSERGRMLAAVMTASNLGPCIGPVVGGAAAYGGGSYEWAFWFLAGFGGVALLVVGWLLPETARKIVGNGDCHRKPTAWVYRTWWQLLLMAYGGQRRKKHTASSDLETTETSVTDAATAAPKEDQTNSDRPPPVAKRFHFLQPLSCLRIILHLDTALVIWMSSSFYALWYSIQATIPGIFAARGFNELFIGLAFLPGGLGVVVSGFVTGRIMDFNYRRTALDYRLEVDRVAGDDVQHFPIENARARSAWGVLLVFAATLVGYGWAVQLNAHPAVPLVLQFVLAGTCTYFFQTFNTLLVDVFPEDSGKAAAAGNVSRCVMSAVTVAVLHPLVVVMGYGRFFTGFGILLGVGNIGVVWLIMAYGRRWRDARTRRRYRRKRKAFDHISSGEGAMEQRSEEIKCDTDKGKQMTDDRQGTL